MQVQARARLRRFRQASALVVALTGLILLLAGPESLGQEPGAARSVEEATSTLADLLSGFTALLPKVAVAAVLLLLAWGVSRFVRAVLDRVLASWKRAQATGAVVSLVLWLLALGSGLSVIAGDPRALVGSVGLVGLALSWALQAPIESFTGWLLNSFRSYYTIGDRIQVGEVFGDVYQVDLLTTTVWESGGPDKSVQGAQPTGALVTFPNSEILRSNIVNYTRHFAWVWDEVTVSVGDDSDPERTRALFQRVADGVVGEPMAGPAAEYARILRRSRLDWDVAPEPQVYMAPADEGANVTVRYLVPARERRKWASRLYEALMTELNRPENADAVRHAVLRVQLPPEEPGEER